MNKMRYSFILLLITSVLTITACENTSNQPAATPVANTNAPIKSDANSNTSPTNTNPASVAPKVTMFTLPMLKAFLADEAFISALKTRLQLTDNQINQLKTLVDEPKKTMSENNRSDDIISSSDARNYADERVKAIVGEEKTQQVAALLNEYWSSNATPSSNAIPPTPATPSATSMTSSSPRNVVPTDTRIVVNAPAYRMDIFEQGQLVKTYKVGIGYPEFPLPIGMRQAKEIIFNPTWTPPDEPWVEASNKVKIGQKIEAGSKLNPLGIAKIPIGLPSLIHGGKSPGKIGNFASHGCVGLTDTQLRDFVVDLAKAGNTELTKQEIAEYGKNRLETKNLKLNSAVPIELRYETIVVEDGKLYIYRDVYDMATNTEENLLQVLAKYGVTLEMLSQSERAQAMNALTEMSRDAKGNLDNAEIANTSKSNANSALPMKNANSRQSNSGSMKKETDKKVETESGKVTRTMKGAKEVVITIAALKDKGYPAPVALNTGGAKSANSADTPKRKR